MGFRGTTASIPLRHAASLGVISAAVFAMTPDSAVQIRKLGHECLIESEAGAAAGFNWLVFVHWLRVPMPAGPLGF